MAENIIQEEPKKKKTGVVIIVVLLTVILLGVGFFGYSFLTKSFFFANQGEASVAKPREEIGNVPIGNFIINLNAGTSKRYLKVEMIIGCTDDKDIEAITARSYQVRDIIIHTLRKKTVVDVSSVETTNLTKKEIKDNINTMFDPDLDIEIYFIDYLVQ